MSEDNTSSGYYTSVYSGEEIDAAVGKVQELTADMTIQELLQTLSDLDARVSALEGGTT